MKAKDMFEKMAKGSLELKEDFNEFNDDLAIIWAYEEIKRLHVEIERLYSRIGECDCQKAETKKENQNEKD